MSDNGLTYDIDEFEAEVARQRAKFRTEYLLRWLVGWPKLAWLLGCGKAGWYLVREDPAFRRCYTIGPLNTRAEARQINLGFSGLIARTYVLLLWEEPVYNTDPEHRSYARPWYRFPPRAK